MRSTTRIMSVAMTVSMAAAAFVFAGAPVSAEASPPVNLGQKVTAEGRKDVSKKSKATVEVELEDMYFNPTFIKAKPGEKITFKVKNTGKLPHTFTSDTLSVDKQLSPGASTKFTVKVPKTGTVFQFHCQFHQASGMVGAVYTKAARATTTTSLSSAPKTSSRSSSYGY